MKVKKILKKGFKWFKNEEPVNQVVLGLLISFVIIVIFKLIFFLK